MKTLIIDACTSDRSRTRKLAEYLRKKLRGETETIRLAEKRPYSLDAALIEKRDKAAANNDFSDEMFGFAKQFAKADNIIVAAPYWDLSFPAVLKQYIEAVNVCGLTFRYSETGMPVSMSNAKRLIYITTAGGYTVSDELGFGYVKNVMQLFYGVERFDYIKEGVWIFTARMLMPYLKRRKKI